MRCPSISCTVNRMPCDVNVSPLRGKSRFEFEHHSGKGPRFAAHIGKNTFVQLKMRSKSPMWVLPSNR